MYNWTYFNGALIILPLWLSLFIFRKDLRKQMIFLGCLIGFLAPFVEFGWFLKDYWNPLLYVSHFNFIWQEIVFGFLLGGIASVIYEALSGKKEIKGEFKFLNFILPIGILVICFVFFTNILHFNSMYSNYIGFAGTTLFIFIKRKDLIKDAFVSGVVTGIIAFIGYPILLKIYPNLIADWWFLNNISGILIIGIPLEEIIWFYLFGLFTGALYEFWKEPTIS